MRDVPPPARPRSLTASGARLSEAASEGAGPPWWPGGPNRLAGAVLCGGASSRMGRDKALIEVGGRALARRVADALADAGADPVVAVGGDGVALRRWGLEAVPDTWPGQGPLGGLVSALDALDGGDEDLVAVLACDLVAPDPSAIAAIVGALRRRPDADVAVPWVQARRQVLHAVWRPRAAAALRAAFAEGERSLQGALRRLVVVEVALAAAAVADADHPGALPGGAE